jgi:hypothetical protein
MGEGHHHDVEKDMASTKDTLNELRDNPQEQAAFLGEMLKGDKSLDGLIHPYDQKVAKYVGTAMKDDEVAKIEALGLTTVEREIVPERFVINPDYADDMKVLNAVSKALQGAKGVPKNLFLKQEAEVKVCVDETALDEIFRKKPEVIARHFDSIVTLAIKPKLTSQSDVSDVFDAARKIVTGSRAPTKNKKALTKKKVW